MEVTIFSRFDIGIDLNDPELVYCKSIKMIQQQTYMVKQRVYFHSDPRTSCRFSMQSAPDWRDVNQ